MGFPRLQGIQWHDIQTLIVLVSFFIFSSILAALLSRYAQTTVKLVVEEALGLKFYFEPVSGLALITAFLAAELLLVLYAISSTTKAAAFAAVVFAGFSAILALSTGRKILAEHLPDAFPGVNFLLALTVFSSLYVLFLALIGVGSPAMKNLTLFLFAAVSGALLANSMGVIAVGFVLPMLALADTLVTYFRLKQTDMNQLENLAAASYQSSKWMIGLGDLVTYSLLASFITILGGFVLVSASIPFFCLGLALNMRLAVNHGWRTAPGILLPTTTTFFPVTAFLLTTI